MKKGILILFISLMLCLCITPVLGYDYNGTFDLVDSPDPLYYSVAWDSTGAAITLTGNTSSNSARSGTATSYTPTTATWYRGKIEVNTAANLVTYTIYNDATGATLWTSTVATNIPTGAGRDTSPCIIVAQSSTDAAADILRLDYTRWAINTTARSLVR